MIRQPISYKSRVSLGVTSVLLMILSYTVLAQIRQNRTRRDQQQIASQKVAELSEINDRTSFQEDELEKWKRLADQPDAVDRTIPTWSMLWKDGLVRASTEQGSFKKKEIWITQDFAATFKRLLTGLVLGAILSVFLGILMGCFDRVEAFLMPPFALLSKVPATAVLPVFFVLVQINFKMYITVIIFGMVPTLAQSISANVRKDVPEELVYKAFTLGASRFELILEVIFRQVLPRLIDAVRLQIGPALVLLIAAEWMVAGEGVGYRLRLFYQRTDMSVILVYVLILSIVGLIADYGLIWLRRKVCPWFGE